MSAAVNETPISASDALAAAQAAYDAARARHHELRDAAGQARRTAAEAAAAAQAMLNGASAGTGTIDAAAHAAATRKSDKLDHAAEVATSICRGALRRRDLAEIDLLRATAADLVDRLKCAVAADIAAAEEFDEAMERAQIAIRKFQARASDAARATQAAESFDQGVTGAVVNNAAAAELQPQELPKTGIQARGAAADLAVEITWANTNGFVHNLRGKFSDWRRSGWGRLAPATTAKQAEAFMRPAVGITGQRAR